MESKYKYKTAQWLEDIARTLYTFKLAGVVGIRYRYMYRYYVVKCTMPPDFFLLQLLVIHTTIENTIGVGFAEERIKTIANNNTDAIVL